MVVVGGSKEERKQLVKNAAQVFEFLEEKHGKLFQIKITRNNYFEITEGFSAVISHRRVIPANNTFLVFIVRSELEEFESTEKVYVSFST